MKNFSGIHGLTVHLRVNHRRVSQYTKSDRLYVAVFSGNASYLFEVRHRLKCLFPEIQLHPLEPSSNRGWDESADLVIYMAKKEARLVACLYSDILK